MSILGNIMSSILGGRAAPPPPAAPSAAQPRREVVRGAIETAAATPPAAGGAAPDPAANTPAAAAPGAGQVDIAAVLDNRAAKAGQRLDWRKSIVDLMKLLEMDSGQSARRKLAEELGYTGDTKDSARMNVWLHKQVMRKLSEHGGKVPPDLVKH